MAYSDEAGTYIKYLDDNMQWATLLSGLPAVTKQLFFTDFDDNGNGYFAYLVDGAISLYKVALEEDILPE